ncbi:hypothetical protein LI171_04945 [Emergencia timonensis]|uniref:hypothetical protein n=1 Tax=Emergencia timonensis TaxID=1776384 RepID=UPI001D06B7BC|nr:hypothetical protein [Emergencia timonensis]MCB6475585.1 hypothetical protein [Emergencia timonensis]
MNVRPLNEKKYKISKYRFKELYYFCLQYNDWTKEIRENRMLSSIEQGEGKGNNIGRPTENAGLRNADLTERVKLIEQTAIEAAPDIYQYILLAVTNEGYSFNYLKMMKGMPCEKDKFYDRRRKFFYLLSKKI